MSDLPDPLVPAFVDLTDFQFMELDVRRLRDSRIAASVSGEEFRSAVLLWCASWHQVPAASLPDDDIELAQLAGFGRVVGAWRDVRSGALYGWIKCSDGRFYHPTVAEKAVKGWNTKVEHKWKKEVDRLRKENKAREQRNEEAIPLPDRPAEIRCGTTNAVQPRSAVAVDGIPDEGSDVPEETNAVSIGTAESSAGNPAENALNRTEQNRTIIDTPLRSVSCPKPDKPVRTRQTYPPDFEDFWGPYPTDKLMSKSDTAKAWARLTKDDRASAIAAIPGFVAYCRAHPDYRPVHAVRFLTSRRFEGFLADQPHARGSPDASRIDFGGGVTAPAAMVREYDRKGQWLDQWGPRRGQPGCKVPETVWTAEAA